VFLFLSLMASLSVFSANAFSAEATGYVQVAPGLAIPNNYEELVSGLWNDPGCCDVDYLRIGGMYVAVKRGERLMQLFPNLWVPVGTAEIAPGLYETPDECPTKWLGVGEGLITATDYNAYQVSANVTASGTAVVQLQDSYPQGITCSGRLVVKTLSGRRLHAFFTVGASAWNGMGSYEMLPMSQDDPIVEGLSARAFCRTIQ